MYATIHRFSGEQAASPEALRAIRKLAAELSHRSGFVCYALTEANERIDAAVMIFETADELEQASGFVSRWAAEHLPGWRSCPDQGTSGEIVVQRGL